QLHLGNACMLTGELARAEGCFTEAQKIVPEEPAPYVNLAQIYAEDQHFDTALTWCLAGLDADKNFLRLWELLAWIYQQLDFASAREKIRAQAALRQSWAGASLAVDLFAASEDEPDGRAKMLALDPFYLEGLRDVDFLVEYTAALGLAGHYDRIPTVLWQVESQATSGLPWQLYFHTIQAYLGLGRDDEALALIERTAKIDGVPPQIRTQLDGLRAEAQGTKH
ncbi:MAG: hypothetical protein NTV34_01330, partial [Proteobacteria bacterium]|nr:hypothetical protein [Pseudomonadota bacterium]